MFPSSFEEEPSIQDVLVKCVNVELQQQQHDDPNNYNTNEWLILEMAVLLYMGNLNDAFLLWRRTAPNTQIGKNAAVEESDERPEGLKLLWKVGSQMFQHNSKAAFQEINNILSQEILPKPLNQTIVLEIEEAYRQNIIHTLSGVYHKIHLNVVSQQLGFGNYQECLVYLQKIGWSVVSSTTSTDSVYLSPPPPSSNKDGNGHVVGMKTDRLDGNTQQNIAMLSDIVTFLERKRVNA